MKQFSVLSIAASAAIFLTGSQRQLCDVPSDAPTTTWAQTQHSTAFPGAPPTMFAAQRAALLSSWESSRFLRHSLEHGATGSTWRTVCGQGSSCNDAYDSAVSNCKARGGTNWKLIGPCSDAREGKNQCVSCEISDK